MIKIILVFAITCAILTACYVALPKLKLSVLTKVFLLCLCATLILSGFVILF